MFVSVAAPLAWLASCAEDRRSEGEDCLKDSDCLSGICASLKCAYEPPVEDGQAPFAPEAGATEASADSG
jgi:hypothetical protein